MLSFTAVILDKATCMESIHFSHPGLFLHASHGESERCLAPPRKANAQKTCMCASGIDTTRLQQLRGWGTLHALHPTCPERL